jgi:hypothetical protein
MQINARNTGNARFRFLPQEFAARALLFACPRLSPAIRGDAGTGRARQPPSADGGASSFRICEMRDPKMRRF